MKKIIAIALALVMCTCMMSIAAFATENTVTVHAQVPADWEAVAAYTWEPESLGSWPGTEMTKNGDWYECEMGSEQLTLIINNNNNGIQTSDLTIESGKEIWVIVSSTDGQIGAEIYYEDPANGGEPVDQPEATEPVTDNTPAADGTYYVAGVGALCGAEWDAGAEANKMTKGDDGCFTMTYNDVAAGSYSIKVTDGSWDNSWGGDGENGNYDFTVSEAGEVVIKFNPDTQAVSVIINGVEDQPAKTGDFSLAAVSVALLAATAGLVAIVSKKEN